MGPVNRQLLLDLDVTVEPTLDNFVEGRNGQVVTILSGLVRGIRTERQVHLWAGPASGKTHLLRALCTTPAARYLSCRAIAADALSLDPSITLWAVDDVDAASAEVQIALFNLVNAVRASPGAALVTTSEIAPLQLSVRPDLRTRLGWGPVFALERLDDAERDAALRHIARVRGFELSEEFRRYLLTHFSRDMSSLADLLEKLDRYALEEHRQLTVPLVREWLAHACELHPEFPPDPHPDSHPVS